MTRVRVALADDHTLVRAGIRALLEADGRVEVVAESGDGREALELVLEHRPDVALIDLGMPGLNGLELARRLTQQLPRTRVIVLSMHAEPSYVRQALKAGVAGYLVKGAAVSELPLAIDSVMRGETYLSPRISHSVVQELLRDGAGEPDPLEGLTGRQREILQLVAEGRSTKEIASTLGLSVKTVETHRSRIMDRLGIRDVAGLVRLAIRTGLVSSEL
jgi:DNA-binding NarL/FixJ family response regulator